MVPEEEALHDSFEAYVALGGRSNIEVYERHVMVFFDITFDQWALGKFPDRFREEFDNSNQKLARPFLWKKWKEYLRTETGTDAEATMYFDSVADLSGYT